ncbi:MAG: hypothetical protein P8P74_09625 [Crocinitomicaceae bacterium]|nr:hypothetical protein [Crocinitomicaceae bacterium]
MNRALLITLISVGVVFLAGIIALSYIGAKGPETFIYKNNEVPTSFRKQMLDMDLISKEEKIIYFYSDALMDITDGLYVLTDQHLILYSKQWEEPETIIGFSEISSLNIDYDDSFLIDSYVVVETDYGMMVEFPLSSEKGRDKEFYTLLQKYVEDAH